MTGALFALAGPLGLRWQPSDEAPQTTVDRAPQPADRLECIQLQQERLMDGVRPLFDSEQPAVLVDPPKHLNLGDTLIWLGTLQLMQALGCPNPAGLRACTPSFCDVDAIRAALGGAGTLVLHGGGNLGDVYHKHVDLRLRLLAAFPAHAVVSMPQSVAYRNASLAAADGAAMSVHPRLTLLARDARSDAALAAAAPSVRRRLLPDSAFALGPLLPSCRPLLDVLLLLRADPEARPDQHERLREAKAALRAHNLTYVVGDWEHLVPQWGMMSKQYMAWEVQAMDHSVASMRLQTANRIFCRAAVVVTDRLHAMLLALLMGRPCVAFDNNNAKISAYRETHLNPEPACRPRRTQSHFAPGLVEAAAKAARLAVKARAARAGVELHAP